MVDIKPEGDNSTPPLFSETQKVGKKKKKSKNTTKNEVNELLELDSLSINETGQTLVGLGDPVPLRCLGKWTQSIPPDTPVSVQYNGLSYPEGEVWEYTGAGASRMANKEKEYLGKIYLDIYEDFRRAAEVHRQVRRYIQSVIRPGIRMLDLVNTVEKKTKELIEADGLKCGWGFPTGCSINECAAHYTPNYGDNTVLKKGDVCKLDFGTHVNGHIIDCAFTIAFDEQFDELIKATQEGTNVGIKMAGIDARLSEIGESIQEAIESHEVTINGVVYPVKAIRNLTGHSIGPYRIHAGKSVPIVRNNDCCGIMEEGDVFAIETFASTGKAFVVEKMECSHYMKDFNANFVKLPLKSSRDLLKSINTHFGTLAFCRRWIDDITKSKNTLALKSLVDKGIVHEYPPLCDIKGSYTSQMEHTIILRPTCKEVVSRGEDY